MISCEDRAQQQKESGQEGARRDELCRRTPAYGIRLQGFNKDINRYDEDVKERVNTLNQSLVVPAVRGTFESIMQLRTRRMSGRRHTTTLRNATT